MSETNATEPVRPGTRIRPGAVVEAMALSGIDRSASLGAALRQLRAAAAVTPWPDCNRSPTCSAPVWPA